TREAFEIYFRHLKPGGMLAVNITNAYLDLRRVVERASSHFGKLAILYSDSPLDKFTCYASDWVLVTDSAIRESALVKAGKILGPNPNFRMWTDDFSNMWSILR